MELQFSMTPYFTEKKRKNFLSGCGWLYFFAEIAPSLIPTENSQMHTLNRKKFYPFTYLELRGQNAPCFSEKRQKFFEKTVCLKNIPSLVPTGRGHLGIIILKKDKKYARRFWRAKRIPIGVLPMGKNIYGLILKR